MTGMRDSPGLRVRKRTSSRDPQRRRLALQSGASMQTLVFQARPGPLQVLLSFSRTLCRCKERRDLSRFLKNIGPKLADEMLRSKGSFDGDMGDQLAPEVLQVFMWNSGLGARRIWCHIEVFDHGLSCRDVPQVEATPALPGALPSVSIPLASDACRMCS